MKFIGIISSLFILSAAAMEAPEVEKDPLPIHVATRTGNVMAFLELKHQKVDTNAPDKDGNTPLMLALIGLKEFDEAKTKNPSQFYGRFENGEVEKHAFSGLLHASYFNMINMLLRKHPDLTITNKQGVSVLDLFNESLSKSHFEDQVQKLLLKK